jgi:hypothetical protein
MGEWMYYTHIFLTAAVIGGGQLHATAPLPLEERASSTYWIGGRVGPTAGPDDVENIKFLTLLGFELRPLGRPARSQSLYRLS